MATRQRVQNSREVLGYAAHKRGTPQEDELPVQEGSHYTVLAHTDWGDYFVPTIAEWAHGETDSFESLEASLENRKRAREDGDAA